GRRLQPPPPLKLMKGLKGFLPPAGPLVVVEFVDAPVPLCRSCGAPTGVNALADAAKAAEAAARDVPKPAPATAEADKVDNVPQTSTTPSAADNVVPLRSADYTAPARDLTACATFHAKAIAC